MNTIKGLVQVIIMSFFIIKVNVTNHFCTNLFMYGTTYLCILEIMILEGDSKGYTKINY